MALVLVPGPGNAPVTVEDWDKINNVLLAHGMNLLTPNRLKAGYIQRGSVVFFAGSWFVADADTAITGSATEYVMLTNTAGTITQEYVANLTGVSFNRTWNGYYDSSGRLYLFDAVKAYGAGAIGELATLADWIPNGYLAKVLGRDMNQHWSDALAFDLSANWSSALRTTLMTGQLYKLFGLEAMTTLTGAGAYYVPTNVYRLRVKLQGPGAAGSNGGVNSPGQGGDSGQVVEFDLNVTPGQMITYSCNASTTVFGGYTANGGGGFQGHRGVGSGGGHGGGYGGGQGGVLNGAGLAGAANTGAGGGGGGASNTTNAPTTAGGAGALGNIVLS
jgi:hypothetical protein